MHEIYKLIGEYKVLSQFRRHPDWKIAAKRVQSQHPGIFIDLPFGNKGLLENNIDRAIDLIDHEFIEELIRNGH
jgi:hypothetical protein